MARYTGGAKLNEEELTRERKKRLGIYYTPSRLAQIIADRAITHSTHTVLDPSFGGASLLVAASIRLKQLGVKMPWCQLFGIDIDISTRSKLKSLLGSDFNSSNIIVADFLKMRNGELPLRKFDLILSNPPFTRHHRLTSKKMDVAAQAVEGLNLDVSRRSSYWVYFLLHSLDFLEENGKLSVLLPLAFLQADYAKRIREYLESVFSRIETHVLRPDYFDAEESVILLEASGYSSTAQVSSSIVTTTLNSIDNGNSSMKPTSTEGWNPLNLLITSDVRKFVGGLSRRDDVTTLNECAEVKIGVVTGANNFFILSENERNEISINPKWTLPIVTNTSVVKGLRFTDSDFRKALSPSKKAFLINTMGQSDISAELDDYLSSDASLSVRNRFHCRSRTPWHSVRHTWIPDAFFHYMIGANPHLVLNHSKATCTNAIHRIRWNRQFRANEKKMLAMSSVSTLTAISSEIYGRSLGGGLLKVEPTAVSNLPLILPDSRFDSSLFKSMDALLKEGKKKEARLIIDDYLLLQTMRISEKLLKKMQKALDYLISFRLNGYRATKT